MLRLMPRKKSRSGPKQREFFLGHKVLWKFPEAKTYTLKQFKNLIRDLRNLAIRKRALFGMLKTWHELQGEGEV